MAAPFNKWRIDRSIILVPCYSCTLRPCFVHTHNYIALDPAVQWMVELMARVSVHEFHDRQGLITQM